MTNMYDFQPYTIFAKCSILDVWQGSEYASALPTSSDTRITWNLQAISKIKSFTLQQLFLLGKKEERGQE